MVGEVKVFLAILKMWAMPETGFNIQRRLVVSLKMETRRLAIYFGESTRTPYTRGKEALDGVRLKGEESVFIKHIKKCNQKKKATKYQCRW